MGRNWTSAVPMEHVGGISFAATASFEFEQPEINMPTTPKAAAGRMCLNVRMTHLLAPYFFERNVQIGYSGSADPHPPSGVLRRTLRAEPVPHKDTRHLPARPATRTDDLAGQ